MGKISYPDNISFIFDSIINRVKAELDPEYIIIAGSFGKGSWIYSNAKLFSDFEFVFVKKKPWSLKKKKILLSNLNNEFEYDISLKGYLLNKVQKKIISNYSKKNLGYLSLDFFDTFKFPQILYSKNPGYSDLPLLKVDEVPIWEAWRLLTNRLGDLLYLALNKSRLSKVKNDYYWLKAFEASAEGYLLVKKLYSPNITKRINSFSKDMVIDDDELNSVCKNSYKLLENAMLARKHHDISLFNISNLNQNKRNKIINAWASYIQNRMLISEEVNKNSNINKDYLTNKTLQNKYLETCFKNNIIWSNIIRLIRNPKLINKNFKFFQFANSWRHIILLTIASTFNEYSRNKLDFSESKKVLSIIENKKLIEPLENMFFVDFVLKKWKLLR